MPSTDGGRVEGLPARRAALQMLDAVLRRGVTLDAAAASVRNLPAADKALAIAIAGETFRRLPDLDRLIDGAMKKRLPGDSKARMVLRLALAQKIGLGTPEHALVATALPLVDGGPRRLVHGVLGTLLRKGVRPEGPPSLPEPVEQRWASAWGEPMVEAARRQIVDRPALDLSFASQDEADLFAHTQDGIALAPLHVRLANSTSIPDLPGFGEGGWWVQDLAASLPARQIPADAADVLDLCAAPGGKTMQLAAAGHRVTSLDSSESRLARLRENLDRTKLSADLVCADALTWAPKRLYDAILLDAPCSATGTFRRHPEVLYRARPAIIAEGAALQARLLDRASAMLKPGGTLIYSVCSLEPQEGEAIVRDFAASFDNFRLSSINHLPAGLSPTAEGWLRILPGMLEEQGGLDGFFVARLVRNAD
jgi:16S rRNA (cytosine967-C5)-methyltransferase